MWTPLGQPKVSNYIVRCPHFRVSFIHNYIAGTHNGVLIKGESFYFRDVPIEGLHCIAKTDAHNSAISYD